MPDGAASYHVAPPLCDRPDGAVEPAPEPEPDLGAGLLVGVVDLAAIFNVVVVRRGSVVDVSVRTVVVRTRATTVVDVVEEVVGASVLTGGIAPPVACRAG